MKEKNMLANFRRIRGFLVLVTRNIIAKVRFYALIFNNRATREELNRNRYLKDLYLDKEIIIFGNGPSANEFDIDLIGSRFTFTVNYSLQSPNLSKIKSDFHVWADIGAFVYNELETMVSIKQQVYNTKSNVFLPIETKNIVENFNIESNKIHYFYSNKLLLDNSCVLDNLTKNIHGYSTVVQWALAISFYMGFKKIYLVGVESTNIISHINFQLGNNDLVGHAYDYTEKDRSLMSLHKTNNDMSTYAEGFFNVLKYYKIINNQAKKFGVQIINLTEKSLIDSIVKGNKNELK